jgi:hypothetical protein
VRPRPALVLVAVVAVLLADVAAVLLHDAATPYDPADALEAYRAASAAPSAPPTAPSARRSAPVASSAGGRPSAAAAAPAPMASGTAARATPSPQPTAPTEVVPGVYRYATSGHEEVDALGGSRHDYPDTSAITYRRSGCGTEVRWQPLQERFSSDDLCRAAPGIELRRSVQRRAFFGQSEEQQLVCEPGVLLLPDRARAGQQSSGRCRSDDTEVALTIRVLDVSDVLVDGKAVEVVHLSSAGRLTGSTRGTTQREQWLTHSGLLVRVEATTDTDRDTAGGTVHYTETYALRLLSLTPAR